MRIFLRVALGCTILAVILYNVDINELLTRFRLVDTRWLALSAIAVTLSTLIGAINLYLFYPDHNIYFFDFLKIYWIAWAIGLIMPGQVGDLIGITAMLKSKGIDMSLSLGRSLLDKLLSLAVLGLFASLGLILIYEKLKPSYLEMPYEVIIGFFIFCCIGVGLVNRYIPSIIKETSLKISNEFLFVIKNHIDRLCINLILSLIKVGCIAIAYWAAFQSVNTTVSLFYVLCLMAISSIIAYIPVSFNGIGTVELTGIAIFSVFSILSEEVLSTYLLLRIVVMLLAWFPTGLFLLFSTKQKTYKSLS